MWSIFCVVLWQSSRHIVCAFEVDMLDCGVDLTAAVGFSTGRGLTVAIDFSEGVALVLIAADFSTE